MIQNFDMDSFCHPSRLVPRTDMNGMNYGYDKKWEEKEADKQQ